ncbi:MAG: hypothetical protein JO266_22295 [Acidobacteria bacterium]|nr:hypothetical protein [Acidobacteriota bacterium]
MGSARQTSTTAPSADEHEDDEGVPRHRRIMDIQHRDWLNLLDGDSRHDVCQCQYLSTHTVDVPSGLPH